MLRAPKTLPRKLHILAVDFFFSEIVRATKVLERKQTQKSSLSVGATNCPSGGHFFSLGVKNEDEGRF